MALSTKAKKRLEVALGGSQLQDSVAKEIITKVAALSTTVAAIATPASATAEDVANKVNEVIAALKAAGLMA